MNSNVLQMVGRSKSRIVTYQQVGTYLARKKLSQPLVDICVAFLKDRSVDVGESFIGPKTMESIINGAWQLPESELEQIYLKAPMAISQSVYQITSDPDMPSMRELTRPVEHLGAGAQRAFIFLSEWALRAVYGIRHEPSHVWKVVSFYDDEPVTTFG